jgi:hypothetical protein
LPRHHREVHRTGNEAQWWQTAGIGALAMAHKLWTETHPLPIPPTATGEHVALSAFSETTEGVVSALSPNNEPTEKATERSQLQDRP